MRDFLIWFFRDDVGGPAIEMYNIVHVLFLAVIVGAIALLYFVFKNKTPEKQRSLLKFLVGFLVFLYLSDFFVHPFMNNEDALIVDKLPFHVCTASAVLLALLNVFEKTFKPFKTAFTVIGMIGAFYYLFIPSGVTGPDVMAFRYRTLQTFLYHGVLLGYGVLSILFGDVEIKFKNVWKEAVTVGGLIVISLGANAAYSIPDGEGGFVSHYDWMFSTGSTFGFSPYLMPFIIFGVFFGTALVVYGAYYLIKYLFSRRQELSFANT